ncbi:pyridoxamine 5'-phosphate oxidase family protein [Cellulomonas composti]|uniref:Pyridoxamine 5'-phosphate oxidase n=1 Tax=Cellulomonas composti TaxID=266130 RepID=A0A511JBA9_9CELL|nr:pyridoxamine 5'-phosphate oxidase family protein [Cellulomonas composti]GEL95267.1 pyridoxamine 5'-phosphate oxidase [Cellulomonas composti]
MGADVRVRWADVEAEAPDLAALVRAVFQAGTNKTLATLRADGAPRISATECEFGEDVTLGMMPGSVKLRDVLRDPRVALHSPTLEPPSDLSAWVGDAKLAGRLVAIPRPVGDGPTGAWFALDVAQVVHTCVDEAARELVVTTWHPGRGVERVRRE